MRTSSNRSHSSGASTEPAVVYTDDGGSGLLAACKERFPAPTYDVRCDARHTVWVKRTDGSRSFGLSPWLLGKQSMEEVLEGAEAKLGLRCATRQ